MPDLKDKCLKAAPCPQRLLLDQIADKWSVLVISALNEEPLRFNMMMRRFEGITQKALTQTLRRLERNGIVARRVIPASPVRVEYQITALGHTLDKPFRALAAWTFEYLPQVEDARHAFDQRQVMRRDSDRASSPGEKQIKERRLRRPRSAGH